LTQWLSKKHSDPETKNEKNIKENFMSGNNDKLVFRLVVGLSLVIVAAVVVLNKKILPVPATIPDFVYSLPKLNAFINATCAALLMLSLYFIKKKNIQTHKKINLTAFFLSGVFLLSYVTYHWLTEETSFPMDNPLRPLYLGILLSHIVLATAVFPLILFSFYRGLRDEREKHRKLVRWSYPVWLYVTISGVLVYLMISPFYTHGV
jgi:putative membrane protein